MPATVSSFPPLQIEASQLSKRPVRRVYDILRSAIRSGAVGPNEPLVESRLTRAMHESRSTVREAMSMLVDDGLITRERRVGTRIAHEIVRIPVMDEVIPIEEESHHLPDGHERTVIYQLERRLVDPPEPVRMALQLAGGEQVLLLDQLILLDGEAVGVRTAYLAVDHIPDTVLESVTGSTHHPLAYGPLFRTLFGVEVGRCDFTIESIGCGTRTSSLLGITEGSPILLVETLLRDSADVPRALNYAHLTGNRIALFTSGLATRA
jgi:GntR family transcriptional regulator